MSCKQLELKAVAESEQLKPLYESKVSYDSEGNIVEEEDLVSVFEETLVHIPWYTLEPSSFKVSSNLESKDGNGPNSFTNVDYETKSGYDYLIYSYMEANLPALGSKNVKQIRIGWTRNLMNEIVQSATLTIDDSFVLQRFDNHWLNIRPHFFLHPGHIEAYEKGVGNRPELIEMRPYLPKAKLTRNQPWFYSNGHRSAFPIFLLGSNTKIKHSYKLRLDIRSLLRMQILENGEWVSYPPKKKYIRGWDDGKLSLPALYGVFAIVSDNEKSVAASARRSFIGEDVSFFDETNSSTIPRIAPVKINVTGAYKALFWCVLNETTQEVNIRSNYTTSHDDPVNGNSPVISTTLSYKTDKFTDLPTEHTTSSLIYHHFPCCPRVNGINGFSACVDPCEMNVTVSVLYKELDATLIVKMDDPEKTKWLYGTMDVRGPKFKPESPCSDQFVLIVRALSMKKFEIYDSIFYDSIFKMNYNLKKKTSASTE